MATVLTFSTQAGAVGASSAATKQCRAEFATLHGSDGETFSNVGQCTRFIARGGQLATPSAVSILITYEPLFEPGNTWVTIDVSGLTGDTAHLYEVIDGFVLSTDVPASTFPLSQTWACSARGSLTVTDPLTGASATAAFEPPPEACTGVVTE
jgi:hypothetical protein